MTPMWFIAFGCNLILIVGMTCAGYVMGYFKGQVMGRDLGYSKGRLDQFDRLTGTMTRQDALKLLEALNKVLDVTATMAPPKVRTEAVHH